MAERWLTNCRRDEAGEIMGEIHREHPTWKLATSSPVSPPDRPNAMSVDSLRSQNMIGIYHINTQPGDPQPDCLVVRHA